MTRDQSKRHSEHHEDAAVVERGSLPDLDASGTVDQKPEATCDPASPHAWPAWKKNFNLVLVCFHAMMTTFTAACIIPAYQQIGESVGQSIQGASYLTSAHILVLGWAPIFWRPISQRWGRKPVWLVSTACAGLFNVGCALSTTYGAMMTCRVLNAFFLSPPLAIGGAVVVELFEARQRGSKLGIWTLMVTLGPPGGPFICGFIAYHAGWEWIYWTLAIISLVQFLLYLFFASETRYVPIEGSEKANSVKPKLPWKRIDPTPFHLRELLLPLTVGRHLTVLLPAIAYSITFGFASVMNTVEIPQVYVPTFGLNSQQLGLQFIALIIGSVLGEQVGGPLSDWWMRRGTQGGLLVRKPEHRLWLSYAGFLTVMVGEIVFLVQVARATPLQWNVTPDVGAAIAAFGNQLVTTVLTTYAIDCHPEHSASVGSFISIVRQTWGFIGPFWFPSMFASLGYAGSGGLVAGLIFVAAWLPTLFIQLWGQGGTQAT